MASTSKSISRGLQSLILENDESAMYITSIVHKHKKAALMFGDLKWRICLRRKKASLFVCIYLKPKALSEIFDSIVLFTKTVLLTSSLLTGVA